MKQKVRVELIVVALLIGGFIGVTFWCKCKGDILEGLSGSELNTEEKKKGCGCNNGANLY